MKKRTLWMNPMAAPSVTSSFQHQVLWLKMHEKTTLWDEPFGCSQCDFEFLTTSALIKEAWKKPHYGWNLWLLPVWLRVFNIKGFDWRGMKKMYTMDEPYGCSQCDFQFLTTSALIDETWKTHTMGWTLWLLPVWLQVFNIKCCDWRGMKKSTLWHEPFGCSQCDFEF